MKRTIAIKLAVPEEGLKALFELQIIFSQACNFVADIASKAKEFNRVRLHHLSYYSLRQNYPQLGAQMSCNAIAKVSQAFQPSIGGAALKGARDKFLAHRKRLQSNGSQSAKQRLRKISGRERRHVRHVNHCIAKSLVLEAHRNECSIIVLEDLKNIRERIQGNKRMRCRLHRWSFDELRRFVEYKATAHGIQILYVHPAYTSQTCSKCHHLGERSKHRFFCPNCGSLQHSDLNASQNLLRLGLSADKPTGDVNHRYIAACGQ